MIIWAQATTSMFIQCVINQTLRKLWRNSLMNWECWICRYFFCCPQMTYICNNYQIAHRHVTKVHKTNNSHFTSHHINDHLDKPASWLNMSCLHHHINDCLDNPANWLNMSCLHHHINDCLDKPASCLNMSCLHHHINDCLDNPANLLNIVSLHAKIRTA